MADTATSTGVQTPPHSTEVEQSVLGALLIDGEAIIKIADLLLPEDFYDPAHREIYEVMQTLFHKHQPIDLLTVTTALADSERISAAGGSAYLAELTTAVPTSANVLQYAQIAKRKSTLRKMIKAGQVVTALGYNEEASIEELLEKAEKNLFHITQTFLKDSFVHIKDVLSERYERFAEIHEGKDDEKVKGIKTGLNALDNRLSGLQPSDLIVVAARPGMGKTSLMLNIAQNAAIKYGKTIGIFSLEMSREQLVDRLFAAMLGVDSWKLQKGKMEDADFQRMGPIMDELNKANIFIDDTVSSSIHELRAKARRLKMEHGLDLIIVDYLQLMTTGTAAYAANRVQEISEISRSLKALGRELHVPILAASQLSRAVESRPGNIPQLSDLRESGSIEQDADVVLMMYREDMYEEDSDRPGMTDIYIRKFRNGPTGRIELMYKKEQMRFYDIDKVHVTV
jgi:replicative DNA helicase